MRRRTFLKAAGGVAALLGSGGGFGYWLLFGARAAARGCAVLSASELHAARAIAEAFFPPGAGLPLDGRRARLAEKLDAHLATLPARERRLVRAGIRAIEYACVPFHGSRFSRLSLDERIGALRTEDESDSYLRHTALRGMKGLFGLLYFEIDEVRLGLGWTLGCTPSRPTSVPG